MKKREENTLKVYLYIRDYIKKHGYAPTNREIGIGVGLDSTSSVNNQLKKLLKLGWIETDSYVNGTMCPRAYRLGKNPLGE